jgi:hypothetical protein
VVDGATATGDVVDEMAAGDDPGASGIGAACTTPMGALGCGIVGVPTGAGRAGIARTGAPAPDAIVVVVVEATQGAGFDAPCAADSGSATDD